MLVEPHEKYDLKKYYDSTIPNVITIEDGIAIPKATHPGRPSRYNFIESLRVGQSFAINGNTPDYNAKTVGSSCYTVAQRIRKTTDSKFRISVRTIKGTSQKPTLVRCWRVA